MKQIFALALLSAIVIADKDDDDFNSFAAKYNKSYGQADEYAKRKSNWKGAQWKVAQLNANENQATFELNFTADLDDEEYGARMGLDASQASSGGRMLANDQSSHGRALQDLTIDWSTLHGSGHVYPVKNQGQCGSCWAFAATGAMEAMESIKASAAAGGSLVAPVRLSEQEFVDCTTNNDYNLAIFGKTYNTYGCNGGWMANAWNQSRDWGTPTNADYPYTFNEGQCQHNSANTASRAGAKGRVTDSIVGGIAQLQNGPMTIALSAGNNQFRYYKDGILTSADLCPTAVDHAILLVGYGVELKEEITEGETTTQTTTACRGANRNERKSSTCADGGVYDSSTRKCCTTTTTTTTTPGGIVTIETPYWNAQNQWGGSWGNQGFIKFAAEGGLGVCGINQYMEFIAVQ